jgi:hypothetical protein
MLFMTTLSLQNNLSIIFLIRKGSTAVHSIPISSNRSEQELFFLNGSEQRAYSLKQGSVPVFPPCFWKERRRLFGWRLKFARLLCSHSQFAFVSFDDRRRFKDDPPHPLKSGALTPVALRTDLTAMKEIFGPCSL